MHPAGSVLVVYFQLPFHLMLFRLLSLSAWITFVIENSQPLVYFRLQDGKCLNHTTADRARVFRTQIQKAFDRGEKKAKSEYN